jgi:hypothetical protein
MLFLFCIPALILFCADPRDKFDPCQPGKKQTYHQQSWAVTLGRDRTGL